eukprot:7627059-Alexandrium_andersonii.AAC.1
MAHPAVLVEVHVVRIVELLQLLLVGGLCRLGRQQRALARGRPLGLQVHDRSPLAQAPDHVPGESSPISG